MTCICSCGLGPVGPVGACPDGCAWNPPRSHLDPRRRKASCPSLPALSWSRLSGRGRNTSTLRDGAHDRLGRVGYHLRNPRPRRERPSYRSGFPTVRPGSPNVRCLRDSGRCWSPPAATTQYRRSSSLMDECWTALPLRRYFFTRRTSSTWRSHCATPAAASPNCRATGWTPSKPTACTPTRSGRPGTAAAVRLPIRPRSPNSSATSTSLSGRGRLLASCTPRPFKRELHGSTASSRYPRSPHR